MLAGVAVLGSQAGHLLAYQLRFGAAAQQLQSAGVHAYFPALAKTSLGVLGSALVAGLFMIGLARILSGRPAIRGAGPSCLRLLAALYTVQLALFAGQEAGEAMAAGAPVASAAHLILWGTLGQLPVAAVAAMALWWLLARFESAVSEIRVAFRIAPPAHLVLAVEVSMWRTPNAALLLSRVAGPSLAKRGPPSSLRFSSN